MYIGLGIAVVAFLYFRKNKSNGKLTNTIGLKSSKSMEWAGVEMDSRKKATAGLQIGTTGMINGTEPCTISELWKDDNDRVGSFKCEGRNVYDLAGGSRFEF